MPITNSVPSRIQHIYLEIVSKVVFLELCQKIRFRLIDAIDLQAPQEQKVYH